MGKMPMPRWFDFRSVTVWLLALFLLFQSAAGRPATPYFDFSTAGAGFHGSGRELPEPVDVDSVKIGVLGPGKTEEGLQLQWAVRIALEEANAQGGYRRKFTPDQDSSIPVKVDATQSVAHATIPFEMIFHPDDGPWGVAASQVVQFAYEDRVWAIIGGLDGQHTHIAELVVAKAWLPVISPGTTDASVDYANVPWVFRVVPTDASQAAALISYAKARGFRRLTVLSEMEREAHTGYGRLQLEAWHQQFPIDLHLEYSPLQPDEIVSRVAADGSADAILLWGSAVSAARLLPALRRAGVMVPVLGPSSLAGLDQSAWDASIGEIVIASPFDLSLNRNRHAEFSLKFTERAGRSPSVVAFYSYDVARMVVQAVQSAGLNRARIRDALSNTSFDGLTGHIQFNSLGGNQARPVLLRLDAGGWRPVGQKTQ